MLFRTACGATHRQGWYHREAVSGSDRETGFFGIQSSGRRENPERVKASADTPSGFFAFGVHQPAGNPKPETRKPGTLLSTS